MKKILLISANRHCVPYPVYPIGVSYLCGYLKNHLKGFEIEVFDCNTNDNSRLVEVIQCMKPDYVGVSLRNVDGANSLDKRNFISLYREIIDCIRGCSSSPLIIGGSGFSIYPQAIFDALKPDFGIVGEGEISLKTLIETLECGGDVTSIEGIACYDKGVFICRDHTDYLRSLDLEFEKELVPYYWKESGMLNIQTKRGCPYHCIYCSYPLIDGRRVRTLNADVIVEHLKTLQAETGVNYVFFTDSVFNINNSYNIELAEKIISSGLKISWGAYFSPNNLTDEMLGLFKASGLTHIEFGTESFSDVQLKNYGKNFTFADVLECSELCLKHRIYYAHFLILGGYGETEETLHETIENSKKIRHSVFFPYFGMRIYPKTKLHAIAIEEGLVTKDDDLLEPVYYIADGFDVEDVRKKALATDKSWIFPDDPQNDKMDVFRKQRNKKGLLWEYLRKP